MGRVSDMAVVRAVLWQNSGILPVSAVAADSLRAWFDFSGVNDGRARHGYQGRGDDS
ncbi:hypothetical protein METHP14_940018 [Pseudomonas sp. P14-2025]